MNVICLSCVNPLVADDCVYITNCGHVFHRQCLFNWMECTNTCPECYGLCTASDVRRLFLSFSNESSEQEPVSNLSMDNERARQDLAEQDAMLSDLKQKLLKNSIDRKNLETDIVNLKVMYEREKEPQIQQLKEQIQQKKAVQKKLIEAKSIQKVLTGSIKDVEEELNSVKSLRRLARMIVLLRRDIKTAEDERKACRVVLRESQQENVKLNSDNRELLAKCDILQAKNYIHLDNVSNSQTTLGVQQSRVREAKKKI